MPFKSLRKGPPTPLDLSSRERTSTSGPASAPYKHYQSGPPPPSSAPSLSHVTPSSPGSFKFWKRKTSASSSPTDASFPPTPPPHSSSSNNTARHHPSPSYASTSSTPLRTSTSNNLPDLHPQQQSSRHASYAPPPSSHSSSSSSSYQPPHPSLYQQQQQYPSTSSPHRSVQLPPLSGSPSSRSALYFDEDYDWAHGQPDFRPPPSSSGSSTYSNSSLPRNHTSTRPSPPGSWHSLPPRNSEIPLSAPLPPSRQGGGETGSPKVYVSTRRTGASSSVGGGAVGAGSHSGWGGAGVGVGPPRRESVGVPVGAAARMGHGRKRSRSMSNLPTLTSPVLMSRPAFDDSSVPLRSSSRRGPPPAFRSTVSTSSRPPPSRTNSPYSSTPSPTTPNFPPHHHLFGMGPPSVRSPLQLSGLPVVVVVPATPDTASVAGAGSRSSGGWGEAALPPIPPSASVAVDMAKRMEEARSTPVVLVSTRPHSPQRALPSIEDAQAAAFIAQAAIDREGSITPTPSRPQPSFLDDDDSSPRKAAIRLPDIDIQELGLSFFNEDVVEAPSFDTPTLASSFSPSESSSSAVFVEDRSSTPPARIVSSRARSGSHPPLTSPPRVPLPARPVEEEEEDDSLEQEEEVVEEQRENDEEEAFGGEGSHGSMPSLSSSFSVDSTISASSSEADWSDTQDVDADSDGGEDVGGGLDEALSEMINSLSTTDTTSSGSPFTTRRESKVYSPSLTSDNTFLLQQPTSPSSASASASLTPKANGNHPLPKSASNSSFVSTSSSILNSPSTAPWHEFPLPPPHTSASAPALSGLGLGIEPEDLLPPRKRQIPSPMLVRDHRRPFYLSASTGCLADKVGSWDETPTTSPTASTFSVIISPPPPPPSSSPPPLPHRSTVSASDIDLITFDSPSLNLSPVVAQETSFLSASSSSSSLASDASGESSSSLFSEEDDLGTVSIAHVQTTESVRWAFARSGSATREVEGVAGWAM